MTYFQELPQIVALDFGTTKFCIASLRHAKACTIPQIQTISVAADGMRRGMLANFEQAQKALNTLLEIAERELQQDIRQVVVGVAGSHLQSRFITTQMELSSPTVDAVILNRLQIQAEEQHTGVGPRFLHLVPLAYQLDERGWVDDPLGFSGQSLGGKFFALEADKHYLADLVRLCNLCGLQVQRLYAEPLASSSVVSNSEAKKYGLVTADIGGGTTDGIIYIEGKPVKTFTINIGGMLMTNDLAIGLGIPFEEAERIKLNYGLASPPDSSTLEARGLQNAPKPIKLEKAQAILAARIWELSSLIYQEIKDFKTQLNSGILLTGGGSEVKGVQNYISRLIGNSVALEQPVVSANVFPQYLNSQAYSLSEKQYLASKYATVVGLLHLEYLQHLNSKNLKKTYFFEKYFNQFCNWLKELA